MDRLSIFLLRVRLLRDFSFCVNAALNWSQNMSYPSEIQLLLSAGAAEHAFCLFFLFL